MEKIPLKPETQKSAQGEGAREPLGDHHAGEQPPENVPMSGWVTMVLFAGFVIVAFGCVAGLWFQ